MFSRFSAEAPSEDGAKLSNQDQVLALELADMWEFDDIRSELISSLTQNLKKPPAVDQVLLGRKVHVSAWIAEGYERLCEQRDPLPKEVGERLGWGCYIELAKLRELRGRSTAMGRPDVRRALMDAFNQELRLDPKYNGTWPVVSVPAQVNWKRKNKKR